MTARQVYAALKAGPQRRRFGFGDRAALVNVDVQCAYTQPGQFNTAYETDPRQIEHINAMAALCREAGFPVVWTYVAYLDSGEDCGVWGTRSDTPDSLQNIKHGSPRAALDPRQGGCCHQRQRQRGEGKKADGVQTAHGRTL